MDFGSWSASASAKGGSSSSALSSAVCWTCGRRGHFPNKCPLNRVSAFEETGQEEQFYVDEEGVWDNSLEDWTVGAGLATAGIPGKTLAGIGVPLLTLVGVNGLKRPASPTGNFSTDHAREF